jgi:hypothetical protein
MMIRVFFLIVVAGFLFSCKSQKDKTATDTALPIIEIKTTPCFGACAVYEMKIFSDGKATLIAKQHLNKEGNFTRTLTKTELKVAKKLFEDAKFFTLQDAYDSENITDLPVAYLIYRHKGQSKTVKNRYGAPETVKAIQAKLKEIAESDKWQTVNSQ